MNCRVCSKDKPEIEFMMRKDTGLRRTECKDCRREYARKWKPKNRDKLRANNRRYYTNNRTKVLEIHKNWARNNGNTIKHRHLKRNFGISLDYYNCMLSKQNGVCAVCNNPEVAIDKRTGKVRNLHVDHDHVTGQLRGLLCTKCNIGLGCLRDNPVIIASLLQYMVNSIETSKGTADMVRRAKKAGIPVEIITVGGPGDSLE